MSTKERSRLWEGRDEKSRERRRDEGREVHKWVEQGGADGAGSGSGDSRSGLDQVGG